LGGGDYRRNDWVNASSGGPASGKKGDGRRIAGVRGLLGGRKRGVFGGGPGLHVVRLLGKGRKNWAEVALAAGLAWALCSPAARRLSNFGSAADTGRRRRSMQGGSRGSAKCPEVLHSTGLLCRTGGDRISE